MTMTRQQATDAIGWAATAMAVLMYLSYIDQILRNLQGAKGSVLQPLATILNCLLWTSYGMLKPRRDWPIILANLPGIALGSLALLTAL